MLLVLFFLGYNIYMTRRGFSIIEILIALFVASAVFSAAVPLIFNTISANRAAKLKLNAYQAAQNEIENLKNQNISTFETGSFTVTGVPNATGTLTVTKPEEDLADIKSQVTWVYRGKTENVELRTYIFGVAE